jgi:L-lysine exporter family protein LysE/ArgO
MMKFFFEGFLLQLSLIFALGVQNIFILETALKRHHSVLASLTCFFCDFLVIMLGVLGMSYFLDLYPKFKIIVGVLGVLFLLKQLFQNMVTPPLGGFSASFETPEKKSEILVKSLSFSLINPHAYLDGFVLIGGYSSKFDLLWQRISFGVGASLGSLIWFLFLSSLGLLLSDLFKMGSYLKLMQKVLSLLLFMITCRLSFQVYEWIFHT